jgi:hypothetical protein
MSIENAQDPKPPTIPPLPPATGSAIPLAVVFYNPEAPEDCEMSVVLTELAVGCLSTLTDFELKVIAAEAGLRVRRALEMPPSPNAQAQAPTEKP